MNNGEQVKISLVNKGIIWAVDFGHAGKAIALSSD